MEGSISASFVDSVPKSLERLLEKDECEHLLQCAPCSQMMLNQNEDQPLAGSK